MPLRMSPGYRPEGTKLKLLPWSFAEKRLRAAHNYWLCSTREDGRPHAAPVWGLWREGRFLFSTDPASQKARNLAANPQIIVHVESGAEVVLVEGRASPAELTTAVDRAYHRKYGTHLIGFPGPMMLLSVTPSSAQAWREKDFPSSATRFALE